MNQVSEIFFSGTFGGETLSLAASVAVLEKIKREPVIERLWTTGKRMAAIARQIVTQNRLDEVVTLKGLAPWITLNFREHPSADADMIYSFFVREMARNGVLTQGSHNVCYAHGEEDIAWVEAAYDATLSALADRLKSNSLARAMEGQVVRPLFKIRPNRS
jgi:glutamate-1-semialdehyde 2,1-aminomutase/spore coat polysaccharide biosynthesis protein SpsF